MYFVDVGQKPLISVFFVFFFSVNHTASHKSIKSSRSTSSKCVAFRACRPATFDAFEFNPSIVFGSFLTRFQVWIGKKYPLNFFIGTRLHDILRNSYFNATKLIATILVNSGGPYKKSDTCGVRVKIDPAEKCGSKSPARGPWVPPLLQSAQTLFWSLPWQ